MLAPRIWIVTALLALVAALGAPLAGVPAAQAVAQGIQTADESGVDGTSYTSPTFGFSISWDDTWTVSDEKAEADYTLLKLENGISSVWLEGYTGTQSPEDCLASSISGFETGDGVSDFKQAETSDGPLGGTEDGRAWGIYDFTHTGDSDATELTIYLDCRSIVPGESFVVITQLVDRDKFDGEVASLLELTDTFTIEGGSTSGDTGDDGDGGTTDQGADASDLMGFILIATKDVDVFWTREFGVIGGNKEYRPLASAVAYADQVSTACGKATAGEDGPFYCPADETMYYDLVYGANQLENFGGNFSVIAVAIAHETGHHIQQVMGWKECTRTPCMDPSEMTSLQIEVQADCFAGAWTADAESRGILGSFDVETNISQFALALGDARGMTADLGAHGKGALRTFWFLNGYYNGAVECLTASAATDPALNGQAPETTPEPTVEPDNGTFEETPVAEPTEEATSTSGDPTSGPSLALGESYTVELEDFTISGVEHTGETLTLTITGTDVMPSVAEGIEADGQFLVVYFSFLREGTGSLSFDYSSYVLVDGEGNEYSYDSQATDALLTTALEDGENEQLEAGSTFNLGIVFDVPADASGFTIMASNGTNPVELDR